MKIQSTNNMLETNKVDYRKNLKYKVNVLDFMYVILLYLLIFQDVLRTNISIFQYLDEILAVVGIMIGGITIIKNKLKIKKDYLFMVILILILNFLGFYSVFKYKYQELKYAFIDSILVIKFFSVYMLSSILFKNIDKKEKNIFISINIKIITLIFLIFTVLNYRFNLYVGDIRYGIKCNQLFFGHPSYLAAMCIVLIANNIIFSKKVNDIFNYILLFILASTLRIKALGATAVCLIVMIYIYHSNKKISFSKMGIIAIICVSIAYNQITYYFFKDENSARTSLLNTSFKIANEYFPIGTGFGTFGSYASGENYSPIYSMYGINNVFGLQQGKSNFISDSFWPMILGQFGYLGLGCYMLSIFLIYKRIQQEYDNNNKSIYIAKIICLIYLLISSTSEAAFVNSIAIPLGLIIGI